jgi:hypothetical protein
MITRKEYNKALDIVEEYHNQLFNSNLSNSRNLGNTPVLQWCEFQNCSARLQSALITADYYNKEYKYSYFIENITWHSFRKIRNAGRKSWIEFVELRGY